ncbi:MAG TPA: PhaM family polyhydroxyalkanoate granule multifunctional regulatory protein [Burkholderiaceae bacterium]|nr:PhaM family polyhydroxyalkanoate granule multifunctional regulatory protein [Burkholderiaceae bacterium]
MTESNKPTGMPLPDALAGNFQDAVRWFNQLWGGSMESGAAGRSGAGPLPSMMMPTLDVKELEKRIGDLRSVEHWLNLNLSLLRTTIQGLEMQRSTLAAWQALGTSGAAAPPSSAAASNQSAAPATGPEVPTFQPALWWAALQQQFAQMAASAAQSAAAPSPTGEAGAAAAAADLAPGTTKGPGKSKAPGTARN